MDMLNITILLLISNKDLLLTCLKECDTVKSEFVLVGVI